MRIGINADVLDRSFGGISKYTHNLIKNLLRVDKKNEYVLIHNRKNSNPLYNLGEEIILPGYPVKDTIKNLFLYPNLVKKEKLDIIHDTNQVGPFLFKLRAKTVQTIHDLTALKYPHLHKSYVAFGHGFLLPRIIKNVDHFVADSQSTKDDIIKHLHVSENKIDVAYAGIDDSYRVLRNTEKVLRKYKIDYPFLLHVGVIEPRKNLVRLVRVFNQLRKVNKKYKLVLVGPRGWKSRKVFETIKKYNLQKHIIFIGKVPEPDLPLFYNSADFSVYSSIYEGFGMPVVEAMACGCPVITSNISSLPEIAGNAAILVNPFSAKSIFSAMQTLIEDESLRKKLSKRGLEQSKKFSWEKCAKQTLNVYEKLVQE